MGLPLVLSHFRAQQPSVVPAAVHSPLLNPNRWVMREHAVSDEPSRSDIPLRYQIAGVWGPPVAILGSVWHLGTRNTISRHQWLD
jgi:hypothetical protein